MAGGNRTHSGESIVQNGSLSLAVLTCVHSRYFLFIGNKSCFGYRTKNRHKGLVWFGLMF